jgi:oligosaccharide repeat unit polymerase
MVHNELSIAILILSIFSVYISYQLLKKVSGVIKIPFISTFFMFKYLIFAYSGSVLLNVFYFEYEINTGVYNRLDFLLNMWYYTTAGLFLIPLGMFIANWATGYNAYKSTKKLLSKNIQITKRDTSNTMLFIILSLVVLSFSVLMLYVSKVDFLPIFGLFDGFQASDLAFLRSESGNNFDGKYYRYVMFMKTLPLLLLFILFFMKNISMKWKIFFYLLLSYNIFVNVMDLSKAPLIKLFLILMLAYFYSQNKISKKVFITTGIVLTSMIMLMYVFIMGMSDRGFFEVLSAPLHRIFIGQISPFYWWQLFQEQYGYLYGTSFPNPAHIFPFEHRRITVEVMNFAHPELATLGVVGSMPTVFFADWFMNFGPLMALFSMVLLGFILQISDIIFITKLARYKSLLVSVLFIFMINYFGKFAGTSFTGIIIDTSWIFPVFVIFMIMILRQAINSSNRSKHCIKK